MTPSTFSKDRLIKSFTYAFKGLKSFFQTEHNGRIHLAITIVVLSAGFYFNLTRYEWALIALSIGMVFAAELFNSSFEILCDHIHPDNHPLIGKVKDMAAAAVLLVSLAAVCVGLLIFLPKINIA
jgi:diacylglycerol kinase